MRLAGRRVARCFHRDAESSENTFRVRHISNQIPERGRQLLYECGYRDNLFFPGTLRMLINIDYLENKTAG